MLLDAIMIMKELEWRQLSRRYLINVNKKKLWKEIEEASQSSVEVEL